MNNREQGQHEYEKKWAQALLDHINSENGSDYIATKPKGQLATWADVDIEAKSPSGNYPSLYLQLTVDKRRDIVMKIEGHKFPVFNCDKVLQAVSEKAAKYLKSGKDFSQITLVIQGTLKENNCHFELTPELLQNCAAFPFKAIYYISAPSLSNYRGENHYYDWFFRKLK